MHSGLVFGFDAPIEQFDGLVHDFLRPGPPVQHPALDAAFLENRVDAGVGPRSRCGKKALLELSATRYALRTMSETYCAD